MARAPVSKTGGWGFESLHSCQRASQQLKSQDFFADLATRSAPLPVFVRVMAAIASRAMRLRSASLV